MLALPRSIFVTPSWFSALPGLTLPVGLRPDYWRNEPHTGDIEKHLGPREDFLHKVGTPYHTAHYCTTRGRGRFRV